MKWSIEGKGEGKDGCTESEPSYFIHSRKGASGYALSAFSAESKSGQFICYKSGQIYLLTTQLYLHNYILHQTQVSIRVPPPSKLFLDSFDLNLIVYYCHKAGDS